MASIQTLILFNYRLQHSEAFDATPERVEVLRGVTALDDEQTLAKMIRRIQKESRPTVQLSNKQVGQDISVNFYLRMRDNTYFSKCLLLLLAHFSYLKISLVILSQRTKAVIEDNDTAFSCQTTGQVTIAFDSDR